VRNRARDGCELPGGPGVKLALGAVRAVVDGASGLVIREERPPHLKALKPRAAAFLAGGGRSGDISEEKLAHRRELTVYRMPMRLHL
jgi:hypothetical protein